MVGPMGFRSEPLGDHDRSAFSCGIDALDGYFRNHISQDQRRKLAAPYVLMESEAGAIVGFYTLSSFTIGFSSLPETTIRRLPKYREFPAILIGRLALDRRYQGRGLGRRLLLDALFRCLAISRQLGAMAVVVDAKDESARAFYRHLGFLPFLDHDLRLYLPMAAIARLLAAEE